MTSKLIRGFFYQELAADGLTEGKPFEALTIGNFVDMSGQAVEITLDRLKRIFANTTTALQAKRDAAGELVGLPIDAKGHENGDAAGWIVGIELAGKVLKLIPRWTELGVEKISKKIQRLFSCTIDPSTDTIVGGSLTNWPAVKGLAPLELSQEGGLFQLALMADESYSEAEARVMREFIDEWREDNPDSMNCPYPVNVYADYLVVRCDGQLTKVPYTDANGTITFADDAEWKPVRMVPVELPASTEDAGDTNMQQPAAEEIEMTKEELQAMLDENNKKLFAQFGAGTANGAAAAALANATTIDLSQYAGQLTPEMVKSIQERFASQQLAAENMVQTMMAEEREKLRVNLAAARMTDGSINRKALPMKPARIEAFLLSLNPAQRKEAEGILSEIVKSGVVDFAEHGSGSDGQRLKTLPKEVAAYLDEGLKIEQLQTAVMKSVLAEAGVTNLKEYDFSRWPAAQAKVHGAAMAAQGAN